MEPLSDAIDFLRICTTEKEVIVKFTKKDGTIRILRGTLDFTQIPNNKKPKNVNLVKILTKIKKSQILSIFDLEKQEWRSIPFDRLEYVQTSTKKIYKIERLK